MIRISEIFHSVQGEGVLCGTPSIFIRTSGCNLRCWFCDTRYASWEPEGDSHEVDSILHAALRWPTRHVVITGGEPMLFEEVGALSTQLREHGKHVTIETAGTLDHPNTNCDLWSISPKLSNSSPLGLASEEWIRNHESRRKSMQVVQSLMRRGEYQLKFVVGSILDAEEVLEYTQSLKNCDHSRVMLMPRGTTRDELELQMSWLTNWCRDHGLRVCDRQHIYWYGNRRGT
jgi:7-carboxy-7-deazaguanine synthase